MPSPLSAPVSDCTGDVTLDKTGEEVIDFAL